MDRYCSISASTDAHFSLMEASRRFRAFTADSISFRSSCSWPKTGEPSIQDYDERGPSRGVFTFHELDLRLLALIDLSLCVLDLLSQPCFLGIVRVCLLHDRSCRLLRVVRDQVHKRTGGAFVIIQPQVYLRVLSRENGSKVDLRSIGCSGHYRGEEDMGGGSRGKLNSARRRPDRNSKAPPRSLSWSESDTPSATTAHPAFFLLTPFLLLGS